MARPREHGERVSTQIRVPVELYDRLAAASAERDLPMNTMVVKAIGNYLDQLVPLDELLLTLEQAAAQ